jgi:CHAT domain-containing protein
LLFVIVACGLACRRQDSPQIVFDQAHKAFLHGDLTASQAEAHREYQQLRDSDLTWAWRFRILEAQSLLWRGMYQQVQALLDEPPTRPSDRESLIEILAIQGTAHARLHQFSEAQEKLEEAVRLCEESAEATCGDVTRTQGVLAIQRGQIDPAKQYFAKSLQFARAHNDRFLEVTSLLNLGLASLEGEHFDEAIDWEDAAYQASTALDAQGEAQVALGNLGWAYYKLGDSERSLDLSLDAEQRASSIGRYITQLYWMTNIGYVYAERGDLGRAKETYLKALEIAKKINSREGIYNAYRALALVSMAGGELQEAHKYSDEAIALANADHNPLNRLYPLLVEGLIAAQTHNDAEAEHIFREVEKDPNVNDSLTWRARHGLAQFYDNKKQPADADLSYRAALTTFEAARATLHRDVSKLPFSNNASRIYDDYICFLVAHGRSDDALRWAEYSRARTLAEGLRLLPEKSPGGPPPFNAQSIAKHVGSNILFYWLGEKQSFLWAITPKSVVLFPLPRRTDIEAAAERYHNALIGPQDVLESANRDGQWLYTTLLAPAEALLPRDSKVFIVADGKLNNLNFETLLVPGTKLHYWIEDATVANASSLRLLAASATSEKQDNHRLFLIGNSVAPNEKYPELRKADSQMASVAKHFPPENRQILTRDQATPAAYLGSSPQQFSYIHFVAHGTASRSSPLDSAIILSRGGTADDSFKLYARDIMAHPLRARLVTVSACYGAGERAYAGEGLVGLSWAFLRSGAHNVIAALWDVADLSTDRLMDKFYDELDKGAAPDVALRNAKLSLLHSEFHNAFYWGPFQLYSGS